MNRPFVMLDVVGFADPITAFIDTGFNGAMIVDEYQAEQMGLKFTDRQWITAVLASQQTEAFLLSRGRINWLGDDVFLSAFVISETAEERKQRRRRKTQEEVVLGVELLLGCRLEIDFSARSDLITRPA